MERCWKLSVLRIAEPFSTPEESETSRTLLDGWERLAALSPQPGGPTDGSQSPGYVPSAVPLRHLPPCSAISCSASHMRLRDVPLQASAELQHSLIRSRREGAAVEAHRRAEA